MLICDAISGAVRVSFSSGGTSFYRPRSRNLSGEGLGSILAFPGQHWSNFLDSRHRFQSGVSILRKQMATTIHSEITEIPAFHASCLVVSSSATFCLRPVVRNPLDRFWHPLRHHWSNVLDLLVNCSSEYVPKLKDSTPTTPSTNQARIQTTFTKFQSKQIIVYFFLFNIVA